MKKEQLEKENLTTLYKLHDLAWNIQKENSYRNEPVDMKEINLIGGVLKKKIKATGLSNGDCWAKHCVVNGEIISSPKLTIQKPKTEPIIFDEELN
tara:strand:- start:420 stop:707 length:288 start_codon:yes stop_codon:yes gene_type:complete